MKADAIVKQEEIWCEQHFEEECSVRQSVRKDMVYFKNK